MVGGAFQHITVAQGGHFVGLTGPARAWLVATLSVRHSSIVIICKDRTTAEELETDLRFFIHDRAIASFTAWDTLPFENVSPQISVQASRLQALHLLESNKPHILIASADSLLQKFQPRALVSKLGFSCNAKASLTRSELIRKLQWGGYELVSLVEEVGDMAVRGSVVDFFPSGALNPARALFPEAGNSDDLALSEVRFFEASSQRSLEAAENLTVLPVRETLPLHADPNLHEFLTRGVELVTLRGKMLDVPPRVITSHTHALEQGTPLPAIELLQAIAVPSEETLLSILPKKSLVLVNDEIGVTQSLDRYDELIAERDARLLEEHLLLPTRENLYTTPLEVIKKFETLDVAYLDSLELHNDATPANTIRFQTVSHTELATKITARAGSGHALNALRGSINKLRHLGSDVAFVVGSEARADRLTRLLLDQNFEARIFHGSALEWIESARRYPLTILLGHISSGVHMPAEKVAFISENEIFGERSYRRAASTRANIKKLLSSLAQLKDNDYVVHADYGIGTYRGLKHMEVGDLEGDFLQIDYADSKLYLPVQNINKIQKFSAAEGQVPVIDKLSSSRWLKTRQKVKDSVITLAGDLIKLYATRSVAKGWRFEPQGAEDERFADGFAYDETPDQRKAIEETLADMASEKPMDRLVCGDVGFGKTEVALRAVFKCVQHARQVALLAPTTILVDQHRRTFEERFKGYGVKIGAISRFYTAQQNKNTIAELASGQLDVVIGTQRLLQRDVQFKDLGLLIIDEEHRFGVGQKEKLKALRKNVDVLTLTATPIPRTLHMSLLDLRDISLITTPPHDRKLIRTYVAQYNDSMVRDAVLRELQRGGQIFYLHNRVDSIAGVTQRLQEQIPEARFKFAHGQMSEEQLEDIMADFADKKFDVLISTTIIESGIDVPNANTIIIERADALGLAQLYQLRGRVGRSTRQAYAYLMVPSAKGLSGDAQKRLKVLQSLDDLGLGFTLAINDLEIRGAGNLLGKEQSGIVLSVGFDLYTRILKEAIANLKGEEVPLEDSIDPEVKLGINAFVPDYYIPDISERLVLYQRLAGISAPFEADDLRDEIEDRFGPLPREVKHLVELMRLRALFRHFGVVRGEFGTGKLTLYFSPQAKVLTEKVLALVQREPKKYRFGKNSSFSITFEFTELDSPLDLYRPSETVLKQIVDVGKSSPPLVSGNTSDEHRNL